MFPDYVGSQHPSEHSIFDMTFANSCLKAKVLAVGKSGWCWSTHGREGGAGEGVRITPRPVIPTCFDVPVSGWQCALVWLSLLCKD